MDTDSTVDMVSGDTLCQAIVCSRIIHRVKLQGGGGGVEVEGEEGRGTGRGEEGKVGRRGGRGGEEGREQEEGVG